MDFQPTLHKLSNGVTVILDPMDSATAEVKIAFATGSMDEPNNLAGITHFCEHMLCQGSPEFPTYERYTNHVENAGGWFNATTSYKAIKLFGRTIVENTNVLLETFADMLKNHLFDNKKIESERNAILDEIQRKQDDSTIKHTYLIATTLFGDSTHNTLGNTETVKSFTRDQLLDWIHKRLSAKNCVIVISGRIDNRDALLKNLETLFNFLPTHDVPTNRNPVYTPCDKHMFTPGLNQIWLDILFPARPDTYENIRVNLAEYKFHKYIVNKLLNTIRFNTNGLVYNIKLNLYGVGTAGVHGIHTKTSCENLEQVAKQIAETTYCAYVTEPITDDIIKQYLNESKLADADFLESNAKRCNVLTNYYTDFGKLYNFPEIQEINKSITAQEVIAASHGFFNGPMSIITFGQQHNIDLRKLWNDNFKQK